MIAVKICGVTRVADAEAAARFGATYIGLNFWPQSRRYVDPTAASAITAALPVEIEKVGVFVNATTERIAEIVERVGLTRVQLHGDESSAEARALGARALRALQIATAIDLVRLAESEAPLYLLDAPSAGYGGSGERCDWSLARTAHNYGHPFFLAGGLTPENVAEAVRLVRPFGVDVAGGVETAPGVKDHDKMRRFMDEVRRAC